jgi:hypothetical protein
VELVASGECVVVEGMHGRLGHDGRGHGRLRAARHVEPRRPATSGALGGGTRSTLVDADEASDAAGDAKHA